MGALRAIDADGHIHEDRVDWAARMPAEFRDRAPRVVRDQDERRQFLIVAWFAHSASAGSSPIRG